MLIFVSLLVSFCFSFYFSYPQGESNKVENIKTLFGRKHQFLNRHRRSLATNSTLQVNLKTPINETIDFHRFESELLLDGKMDKHKMSKKLHNDQWSVRKEIKYSWGISVSSCSHPCGGGNQTFSVHCNDGHTIVPDRFCSSIEKPPRLINTIESCNNQPCDGE